MKALINDRDLRRSAPGCSNPAAYEAMKNVDQEDERFHIQGRIMFGDSPCPVGLRANGGLF